MSTYPRRYSSAVYASESSDSDDNHIEEDSEDDEDDDWSFADIYTMQGFPYPECWTDDCLMELLMGTFRLQSIDPRMYEEKLLFWQQMIFEYCMYKRSASFSKRELQLAFKRGNMFPHGLDLILNEMERAKLIRRRSEYEYDPANSWSGWIINTFIRKPLTWGYRKVPVLGIDEEDPDKVEYIHLGVIKKFCDEFHELFRDQSTLLESYDTLVQRVQPIIKLQKDDLDLILHTLHAQQRIGLEYIMDKKERRINLIKIPGPNDPTFKITEVNRAVYDMQRTRTLLLQQLEVIEEDIRLNEQKALTFLKDGKRQRAKAHLRKKKLLEINQEKRSQALHNIETLLYNVEEAQSNGIILETYKMGTKALNDLLKAAGLNYDNIDEVVSNVRETIETQNDLQETLANANNLGESTADGNLNDQLERELKDMISDEMSSTKQPRQATSAATAATTLTLPQQTDAKDNKIEIVTHQKVDLKDDELMAMLDNLDVNDNSISSNNDSKKTAA